MQVAHFHPARALAVTLLAALVAIAITLAFAARLSDNSAGSAASAGQGAPVSAAPLAASRPAWVTNPFSPLLGRFITPAWVVGGRS